MNARQESQLNMFRAVENHCDANASIISSLPAFHSSYLTFKSKIPTLIGTMQQEDLVTKGITISKGEAKKQLCRFVSQIASSVFAYAYATNNSQLQKEVNFSYTRLIQTKDDSLVPRIKNIFDVTHENLSALAPYAINDNKMDEFSKLMKEYNIKVPDPRNATAIKSTVRTNMKNLISECNILLKNQMDKSIVMLKDQYPDFVNTYTSNRIIIDPPKGQTLLKGFIIDKHTKEPINEAKISIDNFTAIADSKGKYQITNLRLGTYTIEILASGYKTELKTRFVIKQGKINSYSTALEKDNKIG